MDQPPLSRQGSRVRFAEEEPGLEVYHPQPVKKSPERAHVDTAPEVYWADDDNDPSTSKYTFYREGTPTPPEYDEDHEKGRFGYVGGAGAGAGAGGGPAPGSVAAARLSMPNPPPPAASLKGGGGGYGYEPFHPSELRSSGGAAESQEEKPETKGKARRIVLVIGLLLILLPITLGVGLGVGLKSRQAGVSSAGASSAPVTTSPNSTTSTTPGSTTNVIPSSPSPTQATNTNTSTTATPTIVLPDCPAGNNTIYAVPGSTKSFLRICGVDYSGVGGATDLSHIYTNNMAECMNACASFDKCTACGWGWVTGDTGDSHRCWMKNDLRIAHMARNDYCFGILRT